MSIDELRENLQSIRTYADNALQVLELWPASVPFPISKFPLPSLPETLTADLVLRHYTHKGMNDLYCGIRDGKYPKPFTDPGKQRLWKREAWENWLNHCN